MRFVGLTFLLAACTQFSFTGKPQKDPPPDDGTPEDLGPPEAICGATPNPAQPLSAVTWVGENSFDPDGNALINWRWSLVTKPDGSQAQLPSSGANVDDFVPDVAGLYTTTLTVTDEAGNVSPVCSSTLTVAPTWGLWVELWWAYDNEDLDLHVLRDAGDFDPLVDDCSAAGCTLDWGTPTDTTDDPVLHRGDVEGTGPEVIGILAPDADEAFQIMVVDNAPPYRSADNTATIRIWLDGGMVWSGDRVFSDENQIQAFARVDPARGTVEELTSPRR